MLDDEAFVNAWKNNVETDADKAIIWRRYILACAAYHCVQLDGDFVECGAYTGVGVKTVVDFLGGETFPKDFWLYDLFEHEEWMLHHCDARTRARTSRQGCATKFKSYPQVKIFKGYIPDVFEGQSPQRIAYLHIDLNRRRPRSPRSTRCSTGLSRRHRHPRRLRMGRGLSRPETGRGSLVRSAAIPGHAASHRTRAGHQAVNSGNFNREQQ